MIQVPHGRAVPLLHLNQVDQRMLVDPHRREAHFAGPELIQALTLQTKNARIERERCFYVSHREHDVIHLDYSKFAHSLHFSAVARLLPNLMLLAPSENLQVVPVRIVKVDAAVVARPAMDCHTGCFEDALNLLVASSLQP